MSPACREQELDALLAGELPAGEADRVRAHARDCAECGRALSWLKLEREWMGRRAQSARARPALGFEALQARLAAATAPAPERRMAPPRRATRERRGLLACGVLTAVLSVALSLVPLLPARGNTTSCDPGNASVASVETSAAACFDEGAQMDARFGACLVVSPAR